MSLKAARTHGKVSQEETNSCFDLLYQFGYSMYSITQLKKKKKKEREMKKTSIIYSNIILMALIQLSYAFLKGYNEVFKN